MRGPLPAAFADAEAVVRSPLAGDRYDCTLDGRDIVVVPADELELLVPADADSVLVERLEQLVEFDRAMDRRFHSAADGRPAPETDARLAGLSEHLGCDAFRVAADGLVRPRCPTTDGASG